MARLVQFIRGTTAQNEVYGGLIGELSIDTDKQTVVLHDGSGGISPMATERNAQTLENKTLSLAENTFTGIDGDGLEIVSNILGVDDTVVRTVDPQTIAGTKSFTDTIDVVGINTEETSISLLDENVTTINFGGDATNVQIASSSGTTTINNDLSVSGNFSVTGTFTVTEEESLVIADKTLTLADSASPTDSFASGGGIILKGDTDKTLLWQIATNSWTSSEDFDLESGKVYRINGANVLSSSTLGTNVVNSSLTGLGTVTTGKWEANTIETQYGGTGLTSYENGELLIGNSSGNTLSKSTLTGGTGISVTNNPGDITVTNTDRGSSQFIFKNIADFNNVNQIVAEANSDTLRFVSAGSAYLEFDSDSSTITFGAEGEEYTAGDGLDLSSQNEFSVDETVVRTSGSQTVDGVKTFVSTISGDIDGNAASASKLDPGAFINGVFFDGSENINLPSTTLDEDLIAGDGISSSGPYNGSTERTFINSDKGSDQSIFKSIKNDSGVDQFSAGSNTDSIEFAAAGDLSIEFDSVSNRITYSFDAPEGAVYIAGDGLDLDGSEFSVDDTVVRTFGDQTIDGTKTIVQPLELSEQATALTQAVRADREIATGDGLTGGGNLDDDLTITVDETVIRDGGEQSIAGTKTFVNTIIANSASPGIIINEIESTSGTASIFDSNVTTLNIGSAATEINIGDITGQTNFAHDVNLASGSVFRIDGTNTLSADTLGSSVIDSSLESVGTISSGTWEGSTIQEAYGGTGETSYTDGQLLIGNTTTGGLTKSTLTGGTNISIDNSNGAITVNGPVYEAGSGIARSGLTFSVEAGNGLVQESSGLALDFSVLNDPDDGLEVASLGVGTSPPSTTGDIRATGSITAYYSSDKRLKENVTELQDPLGALDQIRGVSFDWTEEEIERQGGEDNYFVRKHTVGVIAQEIEQILPEAVATRPDGYKAVRYELLVPLLIQGMKEQQEQIKMLEEKVETLWQQR